MCGATAECRTIRIPRCSTYQAAMAGGSETLHAKCSTFSTGMPLFSLGQPERSHLLTISHEQHAVNEHRVVPCLALNGLETGHFYEPIGCRLHERQLPFLG